MEKSKVVSPVRIFAPEGSKELGLILVVVWSVVTFALFLCLRANSFGFDLHGSVFVTAVLFQAVLGLMPILYVAALMKWSARQGWSFFMGLVILPVIYAELYFLPEDRAFREEVRRTNPVELSLNRAAPFSFATMSYDAEYGYWTYGWD